MCGQLILGGFVSNLFVKVKNMKKFIAATILVSITVLSNITAANSVLTNSDYFTIRSRLREMKPTEFKARKVCERMENERVRFTSKVTSVNKSGEISADMDGEVFSFPDIELTLVDSDNAENLRAGQDIEYTGYITRCVFNTTMDALFLDVGGGKLLKHY